MRHHRLIVLLTLTLAGAVSASALAGPSIFAGVSLPTGDLADGFKTGLHAGAAFTQPVTPMGSIGVRGAFNRFAAEDILVADDGHLNMIELLGIGKLTLPAGPYFVAGLGLTNWKVTLDDWSGDSETDFTVAAGVGYTLVKLQLEAMYHNISTEGESSAYITASAGLAF